VRGWIFGAGGADDRGGVKLGITFVTRTPDSRNSSRSASEKPTIANLLAQ
jgi:hypothetical protein